MDQQHGASDEVDQFLEDVVEQIQYKPIREEVREELSAHLEDRKEEFMSAGIDESKAWKKAVEQMGDAVGIGVQINEVRKLQKNGAIISLLMVLIGIGVMGNVRIMIVDYNSYWVSSFYNFLWGIAVFAIVYRFGYQKLAQYAKKYCYIIIGAWGLSITIWLIQRRIESYLLFDLSSISNIFALELLSIPAILAVTYFMRRKTVQPFLLCTGLTAGIVLISAQMGFEYLLAANLIHITTVYVTLLYMIITGTMGKKRIKKAYAWGLSLFVVLSVLVVSYHSSWNFIWKQCFHPEEIAENYFDDSYNSVLIKELLGRAELMGSVQLSQEELLNYYTSAWYFDPLDDFDLEYKMQSVEEGNVKLEQVLPQHYQNNDRIAYWILKYGWLPAFVLISIVLLTYGLLFRLVFKIKNKMGKVIAFSCVMALMLQFVFYLLGNFGFQFGWFCNFPFISEGICSITTNMVLVGLACSAYRYDKVVKEKEWNRKRKAMI